MTDIKITDAILATRHIMENPQPMISAAIDDLHELAHGLLNKIDDSGLTLSEEDAKDVVMRIRERRNAPLVR